MAAYVKNRLLARHYLREAMDNPTSLAYVRSAMMDLFMRKHDAAISQLQKALSMDPNDPFVWTGLSYALSMAGRPAEALAPAQKAIRLDPAEPGWPLYDLGVAHFCSGNFGEAATALEKALKYNPELPGWAVMLAAAYTHLGRDKEARSAYQTFINGWGDNPVSLGMVMYFNPFNNRRTADSLAEGLLKAGMPGTLSDYIHASKENQITGDDLKAFYYPSKIIGPTPFGEWSWDTDKDGVLFYRGPDGEDTGRSWVEGDMLLVQFRRRYQGMVVCSVLYKNPKGTPEKKNEYIFICDLWPLLVSKVR